MTEKKAQPKYRGMQKYVDGESGYGVWLPSDWHRTDMVDGHKGVIFAPVKGDIKTCFASEKHILETKVTREDVDIIREGFVEGMRSLPGIEIDKSEVIVTKTLIILDATFTFLEGEERRKRWVRDVYWGEGQLVLIAQGESPEAFDYWMPMFYNIMMTAEVGSPV